MLNLLFASVCELLGGGRPSGRHSPSADCLCAGYVFDAVFTTVEKLQTQVPLIGFCGAPLTLLCYMVEGGGGGSTNYRRCKQFLLDFPNEAEELLRHIARLAGVFLNKQVEAGAQVLQVGSHSRLRVYTPRFVAALRFAAYVDDGSHLQVFDTNASFFSPEMYSRFGVPFMEQIAEVSANRNAHEVIRVFSNCLKVEKEASLRSKATPAASALYALARGACSGVLTMQCPTEGR